MEKENQQRLELNECCINNNDVFVIKASIDHGTSESKEPSVALTTVTPTVSHRPVKEIKLEADEAHQAISFCDALLIPVNSHFLIFISIYALINIILSYQFNRV